MVTKAPSNGIVTVSRCFARCLGNHGRLSATKRNQFAELHDAEIARMEQVLQDNGLPLDTSPA